MGEEDFQGNTLLLCRNLRTAAGTKPRTVSHNSYKLSDT